MPGKEEKPTCPHCGAILRAFFLPDGTGWEHPTQLACFNDECSYYREGWDYMLQQYNAKVSYRYRLIPGEHGQPAVASPLAVWSETALLDLICDDE